MRFGRQTAAASCLLARSGLLGLAVASSSLALGPLNVLERSYNKFRTGADTAETVLTPANVRPRANLFYRQFAMKVDGKIEGSPLYAPTVAIAGGIYHILICRHHAQHRLCL